MNKFTQFKEPIIIKQENKQENGITVSLSGWYDRGTRAVLRGVLIYNEDSLDYIYGVDKSQVLGDSNV